MSAARGDLRTRIATARASAAPGSTERARSGLTAHAEAGTRRGQPTAEIIAEVADGSAATAMAQAGLATARAPAGLACAQGCAFCCILPGDDGGLITEAEARALHAALAPLAGQPDGRAWHPKACPALNPETRTCRAYQSRPTICRAYVSTDAEACAAVSEGTPRPGPGTLRPYHDYLAAIGLARAALKGTRRVATYAMARVAAAAVDGAPLDTALKSARHKPHELDAELKRSRRDAGRVRPAG